MKWEYIIKSDKKLNRKIVLKFIDKHFHKSYNLYLKVQYKLFTDVQITFKI